MYAMMLDQSFAEFEIDYENLELKEQARELEKMSLALQEKDIKIKEISFEMNRVVGPIKKLLTKDIEIIKNNYKRNIKMTEEEKGKLLLTEQIADKIWSMLEQGKEVDANVAYNMLYR